MERGRLLIGGAWRVEGAQSFVAYNQRVTMKSAISYPGEPLVMGPPGLTGNACPLDHGPNCDADHIRPLFNVEEFTYDLPG